MDQPSANTPPQPEVSVEARLAALEAWVTDLREEIRLRRLVIVDEDAQERLVAQVVDGVVELRIDLPYPGPGGRSGVLLFAIPARDDFPDGFGMQLWAKGDVVGELAWWGDHGRAATWFPS